MKKLKFKTIVSVFLSAVVFWSLAVPMMSYATPADFSGNQGFLLAEDIEELEQKVAPGPDYEEGDLIAFKVIDVPLETFDTVGQTPSLRADCTEKPTCQVVLHKIATSNGKCQIDFRCTLASMMTCVRIKGVSGSYTCKDTSNGDSYRQSFNGLFPAAGLPHMWMANTSLMRATAFGSVGNLPLRYTTTHMVTLAIAEQSLCD